MRLALVVAGLAARRRACRCSPASSGSTLLTQIMIFGLLALSADLLLGNAGLFSLCHASFFAVAAYTTAILQVRYGVADRARGARRHPRRHAAVVRLRASRCARAASISS